ncbi:hypothetical protein Q9251_01975 [Alkalihalobacillus macyae]|uniref:hypothetical protein n=1 Tax=Guptibacillus hwajinpoensis TaxID=208199 RepID=UPI00273C652F|nr:hypothetical protein [Alkalihalobacillus macyae]MDP4549646.1 hypothetical protein [Alkalihalobacillus macyae]
MSEGVKVEFEVKAFGQDHVADSEDSFKGYEIGRVKSFPKDTTLGELEEYIKRYYKEVKEQYGTQPEQLVAKVTIRATEKEDQVLYLG